MAAPRLDASRLTTYLRALAEPNRIELLRKLQLPHTVRELDLRPARADRTRRPDRPLAWQTIDGHVKKLQELDLVLARPATRDGREVTEYVVNHARLFLILEELRTLSLIRAAPGAGLESRTGGMEGADLGPGDVRLPDSPSLVLAGGPLEGAAFRLDGEGPWAVGRARGLAVSLPYDLFVSARNAEVRRAGPRFVLRALPARNGTRVNWRTLAAGEEAALGPGDMVGVGRSVLVFRGG